MHAFPDLTIVFDGVILIMIFLVISIFVVVVLMSPVRVEVHVGNGRR